MAGTMDKLLQIQRRASSQQPAPSAPSPRPSTRPEWRRAFEIYQASSERIMSAAAAGDHDGVLAAWAEAAAECSALYGMGSSIARQLALAVSAALDEDYRS